jgi:hypothetical protein
VNIYLTLLNLSIWFSAMSRHDVIPTWVHLAVKFHPDDREYGFVWYKPTIVHYRNDHGFRRTPSRLEILR